jgi:N-acetylmuramoyl-L-alanine amidase
MHTIFISAGHGGKDPGAVANGLRESDVNLPIALAAEQHLTLNYTGHKIIMARRSDIFVGLLTRRDMAEQAKANLYVSVHNNAASNTAGRGFETFIYNGEVYDITKIAQKNIHNSVYNELYKLGVPNRGMKTSKHWVVSNIKVPVVLVEYLFLTNALDANILRNPNVLKQLGVATAEGIATTLNLQKKTPFDWQLPSGPLPPIQRRIGIEVNEIFANEVGYLVNNETYAKVSYMLALCNKRLEQAGLRPIEITPHGDHIKIKV